MKVNRMMILIVVAAMLVFGACGPGDDDDVVEDDVVEDEEEAEADEPECQGPNPAGCTATGCDAGEECVVDTDTCEPSTCGCSDGYWMCTADCGGGGVCEQYDPCRGLQCGASCYLCPPDDLDCMETMVLKACNTNGECVADTGDLCPAGSLM